jgi:hypothetical protein
MKTGIIATSKNIMSGGECLFPLIFLCNIFTNSFIHTTDLLLEFGVVFRISDKISVYMICFG